MLLKYRIFFCVVLFTLAGKAQQVIPLYAGTAPGSLPVADKEVLTKSTRGNSRSFVSNVTRPTLTIYFPKKVNAAGTAVIICPGGGYSRLSIVDGGYEAAQALADSGIVAMVLKYRTTQDSAYTDYKNVPLMDLQQAMKVVVEHAVKWKIDTTHIGILGFSAGGHLTAMAANATNNRRPAFTILLYPVISFLDSLTSKTSNSRSNLLGKKILTEEKIRYSPELHINASTPPAFIVHAGDDSTSHVGNSIAYYNGLTKNKVPSQLLLYQRGGHGFALYNKEQDEYWMPAAIKWLALNGFLKR
jgi:acetyl esterase/lipase